MSSTNRGKTQREPNDYYATADWLTNAIVPELGTRLARVKKPFDIYEPACGDGRMVNVFKKAWPNATVIGTDISQKTSVDFLKLDPAKAHKFDLIATNPPFLYAMEFIEQAMKFRKSEKSVVAMVLRLNFLGSRKRAVWLREHPPAVYVTPKRPSFRKDGKTDSIEYGWFVWQEPYAANSRIGILSTENILTERQALAALVRKRKKAAQKTAAGV